MINIECQQNFIKPVDDLYNSLQGGALHPSLREAKRVTLS